ncbi:MAG: glycosyltransferase family 2 protein [Deltaproteobacteria bacterium]|nr:glycosyltransferase family 2 protein [Deltaproteobacteria bacterium]
MPSPRPDVDLAVIAPCLNERGNIAAFVERVEAALAGRPGGFELVLVDDGSTDGSWELMESLRAAHPDLRAIHHERTRGITASWAAGLAATRAPLVVITDADLQYRPEDIGALLETRERNGASIVQGWRRTQVDRGPFRYFFSRAFSVVLNRLFRMNLPDNKSGFLVAAHDDLARVVARGDGFRHFHNLIAVAAAHLGMTIEQIPIVFDRRFAGASFITHPLRYGLESLADLPLAVKRFRRRDKTKDVSSDEGIDR